MSEHAINDAGQAFAFLLAGKATLTVVSLATEKRLTFQVRQWKKAKNGTMHFVSVRTGNDYAKIGVIRDGEKFWHDDNRADLPFTDERVKGFRYVFEHLKAKHMPPQAEIWHVGQCGRCARPLTDPESIARGIGPECASKMECF